MIGPVRRLIGRKVVLRMSGSLWLELLIERKGSLIVDDVGLRVIGNLSVLMIIG